ncbi:MAG: NF038122 family metalloprotease [Bradyrhizobium sp.]
MAAPASFRSGIEQAAAILSSAITDKITVNLGIDYSGTGGGAAAGPDNGLFESYSTIRSDLINNATPGDTTFNALPTGSTIGSYSDVAVWNAQLKLWGMLGANDSTTDDGSATFATDIDPSLLVGVALHELTHAMGRVPYGPQPDVFDFYRFTSPGTQLFSDNIPAPAAYFSLDGGYTKLADYGQNSDPSDFLNSGVQGPNDPFNEYYSGGTLQQLTAVDLKQLDALGFHVTAPVPPPSLAVSSVTNATAGQQIALSSLVNILAPGHVGYQNLELWDSDGTVTGGQFVVDGVAQTGQHKIYVAPGDLANTVFDAGTAGGSDLVYAQLQLNDGSLTGWQSLTVNVPKPTLTVQNDANATAGQQIALSSLVNILDPGHVGYQNLELWDSDGTVAGGPFRRRRRRADRSTQDLRGAGRSGQHRL